jgi:hypothetical protein
MLGQVPRPSVVEWAPGREGESGPDQPDGLGECEPQGLLDLFQSPGDQDGGPQTSVERVASTTVLRATEDRRKVRNLRRDRA